MFAPRRQGVRRAECAELHNESVYFLLLFLSGHNCTEEPVQPILHSFNASVRTRHVYLQRGEAESALGHTIHPLEAALERAGPVQVGLHMVRSTLGVPPATFFQQTASRPFLPRLFENQSSTICACSRFSLMITSQKCSVSASKPRSRLTGAASTLFYVRGSIASDLLTYRA